MAAQVPEIDYRSLIGFFHKHWNPQQLLQESAAHLFKSLEDGYFALDEIVLEKSKEGKLWIVKRRWKSDGGYVTPAISVVMLVWTNGEVRIPIRFELRRPGQGTLQETTLRLLSWARNKLQVKPQVVLFDAGFANHKVFQRLSDYGWAFVCRISKSWSFEGIKIWRFKKQGFWNNVGQLSTGLKLRAIRRAHKFFVSNRLSVPANELVELYRKRHVIEEVFKLLKGECHWDRCQLRCDKAYERFLAMGCLSFMVWENKRLSQSDTFTIYKLRRQAIFERIRPQNPHIHLLPEGLNL